MSKTAFGLSGTSTLTLVQFYNGKHKGRISPPFVFFYLISPRAFIDAFSFSILSSLILTSGRRDCFCGGGWKVLVERGLYQPYQGYENGVRSDGRAGNSDGAAGEQSAFDV